MRHKKVGVNLNEPHQTNNIHRQVIAICVGVGLNIALLPLTYFIMAIGGSFLVSWIDVSWHFPISILFYYVTPAVGMVFSGFVTAHLAKNNIYKTCFILGVLSPLALVFVVQFMISLFQTSPGYDWLSEPEILGFFLMHIPTMLFGGFLYQKYFKASTKSNQLDSDLADEYL